jgi:hypothetical protein
VDGRKMKELVANAPPVGGRWKPAPGSVPDLNTMPLTAFQDTVGAFLQDMGFTLQKIRKMNDGAILARVEEIHPLIGGEFVVIARQVPEKSEVPAETVLETTRIMNAEFCRRGILLVTGRFSAEAQAAARSMAVELVDKPRWVRLYTGG